MFLSSMIALLSLWPFGHADVRHIGAWRLSVETDRFSAHTACHLSRRRVEYRRHALVLHLAGDVDTTGALYRIDAGPPITARDDQMTLARLGFALNNDDLENPSGGLVRIPIERVGQARSISVEPAPNRKPIRFKVDGLSAALEAANKADCSPD